jgi:hypothetical protein
VLAKENVVLHISDEKALKEQATETLKANSGKQIESKVLSVEFDLNRLKAETKDAQQTLKAKH